MPMSAPATEHPGTTRTTDIPGGAEGDTLALDLPADRPGGRRGLARPSRRLTTIPALSAPPLCAAGLRGDRGSGRPGSRWRRGRSTLARAGRWSRGPAPASSPTPGARVFETSTYISAAGVAGTAVRRPGDAQCVGDDVESWHALLQPTRRRPVRLRRPGRSADGAPWRV